MQQAVDYKMLYESQMGFPFAEMQERRIQNFYVRVNDHKFLCVAYKYAFISPDTNYSDLELYENEKLVCFMAAGCIMTAPVLSKYIRSQLFHTAFQRVMKCPIVWYEKFNDSSKSYDRRLRAEKMVRKNNCKGVRLPKVVHNNSAIDTINLVVEKCDNYDSQYCTSRGTGTHIRFA
tara:strand:+ start:2555 stop:3082 length:528 start_codon:yes stop_codon:yes gene_type:complete